MEESLNREKAKNLCIFCCYSFVKSPGQPPPHCSSTSSSHLPPSPPEGEEDVDEENKKQFEKFLEIVVDVKIEDPETVGELALLICGDCMGNLRRMVDSKEKAEAMEGTVRRLQKELLGNLEELDRELGVFTDELKVMKRTIEESDVNCLSSYVKKNEIGRDVYSVRGKVDEVIREFTSFRTDLKPKFNCDVPGGVRGKTLEEVKRNVSSDEEEDDGDDGPIEPGGPEGNDKEQEQEDDEESSGSIFEVISGTGRSAKSAPRTRSLRNSNIRTRREIYSLDSPPGKNRTREASKRLRDQKENRLEEVEDDEEDMDQDKPSNRKRSHPFREKEAQNNGRKVTTPIKKNEDLNPKTISRQMAKRSGPAPRKPIDNKVSPAKSQRSSRPPRRRPQKSPPDLEEIKNSEYPKLVLERLTPEEIAKHSKKRTIKKKVVSFGSSDDTEESSSDEENDEDTSSCDSISIARDSCISFIHRRRLHSAWKRKVIAGLKGKMNYEQREMEKNGRKLEHTFRYNKRTFNFTLGRVSITFDEVDKTLGCGKCKGTWKTSHNEMTFYQQITGHILRQHLGLEENGEGASISNGSQEGMMEVDEQEVNENGDWDPGWEDDEGKGQVKAEKEEDRDNGKAKSLKDKKEEEMEDEEEKVVVTRRSRRGPVRPNIEKEDKGGRAQRSRRPPDRFVKSEVKEEEDDCMLVEDQEEEKERSGAEEWTPEDEGIPKRRRWSSSTRKAKETVTSLLSVKSTITLSSESTSASATIKNKSKATPPSKDETGPVVVTSKMKFVMDLMTQWDLGREGKSALELVKKNGVRRTAQEICTLNYDTGDIRVVGLPVIFKEDLGLDILLECSRCDHSVEVEIKEDNGGRRAVNSGHRDIVLHILESHTKAFTCKICDEKMKTPVAYSNHVKQHGNMRAEQEKKGGTVEKNEKVGGKVWEEDKFKIGDGVSNNGSGNSSEGTRKKISRFGGDGGSESSEASGRSGKISLKKGGGAEGRNKAVKNRAEKEEEEEISSDDNLLDV